MGRLVGQLRPHAVGDAELSDVGPGETDQSQTSDGHINRLGRLAGYCGDPSKRHLGAWPGPVRLETQRKPWERWATALGLEIPELNHQSI